MKAVSPLAALTSAAMSLPVFAATQPTDTSISVKTSSYSEKDISAGKVVAGSNDRYDIDIHQFQLVTPIGSRWAVGIEASRELMSGASPWGTITGADGKPALIMSGATISDSRTEASITASRYYSEGSFSVSLTRSEEDDYQSDAITLGTEHEFFQSMGTLSLGISYASDDIEPTDAALFGRVSREKKSARSISAAWTQILNAKSLLQAGVSLTKKRGYLSDPYKLRDVRPDSRFEKSFSVRYRRHLDSINASFHLDYRYFHDDFGIRSHTIDLNWHQPVTDTIRIVPGIRYYSQSQANFFQVADDFSRPIEQAQSSDYRLSSYGAISVGLKGVFETPQWRADLTFERYLSEGDYGHDSPKTDHPALLDFNLLTLGLGYRF